MDRLKFARRLFELLNQSGSALLFRHQRWHESEHLESGVKDVLRSDVVFAY